MPASHWLVRKVKGKRGAGAPFSLNRDQNSSHFHDLPSFERSSESQTEQTQGWILEAAFCRLTMASQLPGDSWETSESGPWEGATYRWEGGSGYTGIFQICRAPTQYKYRQI